MAQFQNMTHISFSAYRNQWDNTFVSCSPLGAVASTIWYVGLFASLCKVDQQGYPFTAQTTKQNARFGAGFVKVSFESDRKPNNQCSQKHLMTNRVFFPEPRIADFRPFFGTKIQTMTLETMTTRGR